MIDSVTVSLFNFWFDKFDRFDNQKQEPQNSDCETSRLVYVMTAHMRVSSFFHCLQIFHFSCICKSGQILNMNTEEWLLDWPARIILKTLPLILPVFFKAGAAEISAAISESAGKSISGSLIAVSLCITCSANQPFLLWVTNIHICLYICIYAQVCKKDQNSTKKIFPGFWLVSFPVGCWAESPFARFAISLISPPQCCSWCTDQGYLAASF